jgi:hypothetical protein
MSDERVTRREIIKKGAHIAPLILTVRANFSFASAGSGDYYTDPPGKDKKNQDKKDKKDYQNNFLDLTNKTKFK